MLSVSRLKERRAELLANVEALSKMAADDGGRDFTDAELNDVNEWMAEIETIDSDKLPKASKWEELKKKQLQEQAQAQIERQRQAMQQPASYETPDPFSDLQPTNPGLPGQPRLPQAFQQPVQQHMGTPWNAVTLGGRSSLMALDSEDEALCLGMFMRAMAWGNKGDEEALRFCQSRGIVMRPDQQTGFMTMDSRSKLIMQPGRGYQSMDNIVGDVAGTPEKGGYLVPTLLANMILKVVNRWIIARQVSRVVSMAGENVDYPKHANSDLVISKPNAGAITQVPPGPSGTKWERGDEVADITASDVEYDQVHLRAADAFTLTKISNRLLRENVISAADQVVQDAARAIAKQMDYEMLVADGTTGTPDWGQTGLVTALDSTGTVTAASGTAAAGGWSQITDANISQMMALLQDRFYETPGDNPQCCFICSRAFYHTVFERLQIDKAFQKMDVAGRSYFSYSGYPIYFSEHMSRDQTTAGVVCLFGNFYETTLTGIRQDVSVAMSDAPFFQKDQMAIRVKASWHVNNHRDGTEGEGYVGLKTAA